MKNLGILILLAGLVLGGYSLSMDVSVDVPARDFGYGLSTPAMKVANADRMAQRQNFLIFSGILALVGSILAGFGAIAEGRSKHGRRSLGTESRTSEVGAGDGPRAPASPVTVSICPKCRHMGGPEDVECGRCGTSLATPAV